MKQTNIISMLQAETERRNRIKTLNFVAGAILRSIHVPDDEKGLIPLIGNPYTRTNHEAVVSWVKETWPGAIVQPQEVARILATSLVAILVDAGP